MNTIDTILLINPSCPSSNLENPDSDKDEKIYYLTTDKSNPSVNQANPSQTSQNKQPITSLQPAAYYKILYSNELYSIYKLTNQQIH